MASANLQSIPDWDRIYRPGVEFRAYPALKWERAWAFVGNLWSEFNGYREALGQETTVELSADRRTATFRARIQHEPPIEHWALTLGDALQNYRSALDGLAWELANLDGKSVAPEHERSLYFPLCETEEKWEKLKSTKLASMPEVLHSRLQTVQPYRFEPVHTGIGLLLNKMSNVDKHRAGLPLELYVADKTHFGVAIEPESPNSTHDFDYEFVGSDRSVKDGDTVFVFHEHQPVKRATIEKLPLVLTVNVDGHRHDVFRLLSMIDRQVAGTFINACVGITSTDWAQYLREEGERPESAWHPNFERYTAEMRAIVTKPT